MALKKFDSPREKSSFTFDVSVKDGLEDAWLKLRRMLRGKNISKSVIVEEALKMVLNDLKKNKEASKIYKILSKD